MYRFTVTPDGGEPFEMKSSTRDVLVWEKAGRGRSLRKLAEDLQMADVYAVAHVTAKRLQLFTGDLKEFEETCDLSFSEDYNEAEDAPDPTQSAPSTGS